MLKPGLTTLLICALSFVLPVRAFVPQAQAPSAHSPAPVQLPKGQIIDKVLCVDNAAQSYALYLPTNYSADRQWPILYALDPGARGKIPVERFKEAAERFGWIVVGSNNSRNGPMQPSADAWNAIWQDTHERFALDEHRVYATGLSGGARTAILFAHLCGDCVTGIIASGAGFPEQVPPSSSMHFVFFGTVGLDDFNFPEMKDLENTLSKVGITRRIRVFGGRHEWAPQAVATESVEWMELQAMKTGKRQRDDKLINELWQKYLALGEASQAANEPYDAYQIFVGARESFNGLHDSAELEKRIKQLANDRAVKDAVRQERQQTTRQREAESQIYKLISTLISGDDMAGASARLRNEITELKKSTKAEHDSGDRRVARRVIEGLSVGLMEQGRELLQTQNRPGAAAIQFELATEINSDRPGAFFYLAWANALNGEKKKALQALQQAIEKGFSDVAAITDNKAFDSLRKEPQYQQLIQSLKSGHP
jgi:tetratricopeptide (TPR) repeat protein